MFVVLILEFDMMYVCIYFSVGYVAYCEEAVALVDILVHGGFSFTFALSYDVLQRRLLPHQAW